MPDDSQPSGDLWDKSNPDGIYPRLEELEARLGLPNGFCERLRLEDDWSFFIKLHALLESALTSLLAAKVNPNLHNTFSKLEMSREDTGKVAFARALGLLHQADRRYIRSLSEIRNVLVHGVSQVAFDLRGHVSRLDGPQLDAFAKAFGLWSEEGGIDLQRVRDYARDHSKALVWQSGL